MRLAYRISLAMGIGMLLTVLATAAALGTAFSYQGKLLQNNASPTGAFDLQFSLWDAASGGAQQGSTITFNDVAVSNGLFTVVLNSSGQFGANALQGDARWLAVAVLAGASNGAYASLTPRQSVTAAPYAEYAMGPWVTTGTTVNFTKGNAGIGTASPHHRLAIGNGPLWTSSGWGGGVEMDYANAIGWKKGPGDTYFGIGQTGGPGATGLYFFHTASAPGQTASAANYDMVLSSQGYLGLGTNAPLAKLDVRGLMVLDSGGGYSQIFTGTGNTEQNRYLIVLNSPASASASGLKAGGILCADGFDFANPGKNDLIVKGNIGVGTANPVSKVDIAAQDGLNIRGFQPFMTLTDGNASNARGRIQSVGGTLNFFTEASFNSGLPPLQVQNTGLTLANYGVQGINTNLPGVGGKSNSSYGVYGETVSGTAGVYGTTDKTFAGGPEGHTSYGVFGESVHGEIGVYAHATGNFGEALVATGETGADAADFFGTVHVFGNLSKSGGSFKIDHPLDPANKYLEHSFVESPDMMDVYNGNITTDGTGHAVIVMPEWFEALNKDFRYQLTVMDDADSEDFTEAKVVKKMKDNQFTIRTSRPHAEVSWQVTGVRHDAWADAHRIPVEEAKPAHEKGTYLAPELFGKPKSMGLRSSHLK